MRTPGQGEGKCKDPIISCPNFTDQETETPEREVTQKEVTEPGLEFWSPVSRDLIFTTPTPKLAKWFKLHEGTSTWTAVERKECPQMVVKDSQSKGSWTTLITTCGKTKVFNSMESHP